MEVKLPLITMKRTQKKVGDLPKANIVSHMRNTFIVKRLRLGVPRHDFYYQCKSQSSLGQIHSSKKKRKAESL